MKSTLWNALKWLHVDLLLVFILASQGTSVFAANSCTVTTNNGPRSGYCIDCNDAQNHNACLSNAYPADGQCSEGWGWLCYVPDTRPTPPPTPRPQPTPQPRPQPTPPDLWWCCPVTCEVTCVGSSTFRNNLGSWPTLAQCQSGARSACDGASGSGCYAHVISSDTPYQVPFPSDCY